MSKLNSFYNKKSESGFDNFDDCAVYRLNNKQSIIQTLDFFTPIVDDPYMFGKIAAANSLSDIYAMGGKPLFALNIVAFPTESLDLDILSTILKGGKDKCLEAGVNILGGHSIKDESPKYGLAVTGIIDNNKIKKNSTARKGNSIILTKPLGTGIITTAIKKGLASESLVVKVQNMMSELNNNAAETMNLFNVNACTDVTGYGLLGHLIEMCDSSNLTAEINFKSIPFLDETLKFAKKNIIPGGSKNNLTFYKNKISFTENIHSYQKLMLADAQTSGGLLIAVSKDKTSELLKKLNKNSRYESHEIGEFVTKKGSSILVKNE